MRKVLVVFILIIFSISIACASVVVTGVGSGPSPEIALSNARTDLASQFSVNISSLTLSSISDDGGGDTSSLSSLSVQTTSFNLFGAQETTTQNEDGSFSATSSLSDAQVPLYEAQLNNLFTTINELLPYIDPSGDFEVQKDVYPRLISALREYEIYQIVVLVLSPDSNIGKRALPVTRFIIENEYQSRLTLEKNETEIMVSSLMQQSQIGILPSNDELLADALARLEEIKAQQEQMDQLVTGDMALMLDEFGLDSPEAHDATSDKDTDNNFESLINSIEANRATIQAIRDNANEWLKILEDSFHDEINSIHNNNNYSSREIKQEVERKRRDYTQKANSYYLEAFNIMSEIARDSLDLVDELSNRTFTATSNDSYLTTYIEGYFDNAQLYSGIADITIGNESIRLYFRIPYDNWIGSAIPSESNRKAYLEYEADTGYWLEILQDYPSIYTLEVDFTVSTDYSPSYEVKFSQFRIIRNDTGKQVFSFDIDQTDTLTYESRTNLTEFSVTYDELLDTSLFIFKPEEKNVHTDELTKSSDGPEKSIDINTTTTEVISSTQVYKNDKKQTTVNKEPETEKNAKQDDPVASEQLENQEKKPINLSIIGEGEILINTKADDVNKQSGYGGRLSLLTNINSRLKIGGVLDGIFYPNKGLIYIGASASWLMASQERYNWYFDVAVGPGISFSYNQQIQFTLNGSLGVSMQYVYSGTNEVRISLQFAKSGEHFGPLMTAGLVFNLGGKK